MARVLNPLAIRRPAELDPKTSPFFLDSPSTNHFRRGFVLWRIRSITANSDSGPLPSIDSDFTKKPQAPSFCICFAFFRESPVRIIVGMEDVRGSFFKAFNTSSPLILGSMTSSSMNDGICSRASVRARSPSAAEITSYPAATNARSVDTRRNLLSSAKSIFTNRPNPPAQYAPKPSAFANSMRDIPTSSFVGISQARRFPSRYFLASAGTRRKEVFNLKSGIGFQF